MQHFRCGQAAVSRSVRRLVAATPCGILDLKLGHREVSVQAKVRVDRSDSAVHRSGDLSERPS